MLVSSGRRYVPDALDTIRATVHGDRNALYVFKLRYDGHPNTLPDMVYNGEVGPALLMSCLCPESPMNVGKIAS